MFVIPVVSPMDELARWAECRIGREIVPNPRIISAFCRHPRGTSLPRLVSLKYGSNRAGHSRTDVDVVARYTIGQLIETRWKQHHGGGIRYLDVLSM